ncbi:MAG TPA: hypothetical protein VLE99_02860 [Candidatus Saccharimonadales bacterium]|nr:hypothetical protein [Candidatus Saccharimonadales bacterium]
MNVADIEALPVVRQASQVLHRLQEYGLGEPAIAGGWTRGFLTDITPSDIDVAYVGPVLPEAAQAYLCQTLDELSVDTAPWDIKGIWNASLAYGVTHTVQNYLLYYINSIDSVYLRADGRLHDPTGHGFTDAATKTLRLNTYDSTDGRTPTAKEEVYICLEGCRRIARFGWTPTPESRDRICTGTARWHELTPTDQLYYLRKKILGKYALGERAEAQGIYGTYGWSFVFDQARSLEVSR